MTVLDRRGFLLGFATFVFFTSIAADFWRNSISWYGYAVLVVIIATLSAVILVRQRAVRIDRVPWPLIAFLALAAASALWSAYPPFTLVATGTQLVTTTAALAIALVLPLADIVRTLGWALRVILAGSLVFELVVSLVVRAPVFPVWVTAEDRVDPPALLYWSRDLLLAGDKIQGIQGSSSLLAMSALVALVVFGIQMGAGSIGRRTGAAWLTLAALMVALTRSATIYIGIVAVAVVLAMILLTRRARTRRSRAYGYVAMACGLVVLVAGGFALRGPLLSAMGKSTELTGRVGIWDAVIGLAQQRPVLGWGWISFWAPWLEPFRHLIKRGGVQQLHAHNAWLDIWLQLGVVGLVVFGALVVTTLVRSWILATTRTPDAAPAARHAALLALPVLLLTALLVQSLAESRLLTEGGWVLLVVVATSAKLATSRGRAVAARPLPATTAG